MKSISEDKTLKIFKTTTAISKKDIIFKLNKSNNVINVLFLGRIEKLKGLEEIIDAICILQKKNILDSFCFNFVGHENNKGYIKYLNTILLKNNVDMSKVNFKGRITGFQKFNEYSNNDIYLFPSYTEGCPTTVLEALASGLFCITTPVGALHEIIEPNFNGILINVRNKNDIVDSLIYCKNEKFIFNNRKEISKRSIIKFDIDNICNKFNENYKKILNENI